MSSRHLRQGRGKDNNKRLTKREKDILNRQRQVATQITRSESNDAIQDETDSVVVAKETAAGSASSGGEAPSSDGSSRMTTQQRLIQAAQRRKKLDEIFSRPKSSSSSGGGKNSQSSDVKELSSQANRPKRAMMRPKAGSVASREAILQPTSAAAAVAAARNRLGIKKPPPPPPPSDAQKKRSGVASILGSSAELASASASKHYPKHVPDDFWSDVHEWDFLLDLNNHMASQRKTAPSSSAGNKNASKRRNSQSSNNNRVEKRPRMDHSQTSNNPSQSTRGYATNDTTSNTTPSSTSNTSSSEKPVPDTNLGVDKKNNQILDKNKDGKDGEASNSAEDKPLPDSFESARQYVALWAPLCLKEARAQMLAEVGSEVPFWSKPGRAPIPVSVCPLAKDVGGTTDFITLQLRPRQKEVNVATNNSPQFVSGDIIVLANDPKSIIDAGRGRLQNEEKKRDDSQDKSSFSLLVPSASAVDKNRKGLLGHSESSRRTYDGLHIKVSRRLWPIVGTQDMFMMKLGGNVTALREFTALCKMGSIRLRNYIMGLSDDAQQDDDKESSSAHGNNDDDKNDDDEPASAKEQMSDEHGRNSSSDTEKLKLDLLDDMGGDKILGKGFTTYARNKFNPSQLTAISAAAREYGDGGFTLVKGPPGTGKTTTLVALLNSLHIRQFNRYYEEVRQVAAQREGTNNSNKQHASLANAAKAKPRLLVCAPSNAAVDNVIMKIMEDGFVDGNGCRYNPSIVRVGIGQSPNVKDVALESKVDSLLSEATDAGKVSNAVITFKVERTRIHSDIARLRRRIFALTKASPWPLSKDWEIRVEEETFDQTGRVFFVNHKEKRTTFDVPPPPEPGEHQFPATAMPEYRAFMSQVVKLVERYTSITTKLERYTILEALATNSGGRRGAQSQVMATVRQQLEAHILDSTHIVMTTLGTAGNRALESAMKFEVVVVDEAAQSVEPSTLVALQLGSSHAILVGDPQQLPATIFSVSGRGTKYDRSLFQRLEESGHPVHLLDTQYRMNPAISNFPRMIFYGGNLKDGPNVQHPEYGNPLRRTVYSKFPNFQPFTVLDLDSMEERGGTSLSNSAEARLALHLYISLNKETDGLSSQSRVAVITPYSQQAALLRRTFMGHLGGGYERSVEINTVDAFQGREASIVIFSCVRAAGSRGIGFLSDVRRMNVALTRAKNFLFVIARCKSIVVNPYWNDLVRHARESKAVIKVPMSLPDLKGLKALPPPPPQKMKVVVPLGGDKKKQIGANKSGVTESEDGEI